MANRRGNPNWGKPLMPVPAAIATSFEQVVTALRLSKTEYETSDTLKDWVRKNKDSKYVPSALLEVWGFTVKVD